MDYIVSYIEGTEIVESELLALVHGPSETYSVESVENLMVGIAAYFVFRIYETVVNIAFSYKFRDDSSVLNENGLV